MSAYNAEKTIKRAIDSVLEQTLKDFELIIVNDCSVDNTENIILSYKDDRIKYVKHDVNKGAGASRNTGVKLVKGQYIKFLDSDDYLSKDCLQVMYLAAITHNCEIVVCGQSIEDCNCNLVSTTVPTKLKIECGKDRFTPDINQAKRFLNLFLVKSSLFDTIEYSNKRYCEDTPTLFKLVYLSNSIVQIPYIGYHYTLNEGSLVHTCSKTKSLIYECLAAVDNLSFLKEKGEYQNPMVFKQLYKKIIKIKGVYKNFPNEMKEIENFKNSI